MNRNYLFDEGIISSHSGFKSEMFFGISYRFQFGEFQIWLIADL
jgi:hypothetical protein